jgi:hypothetical protein
MSFDIALAGVRKFGTVTLLLCKGASIMRELVVLSTSTVRGRKTRAGGSRQPPGRFPPVDKFGVAIPSCTGSSRMACLRAAMIHTSGPTGKGVVNAMSDLDVTSFTTRPQPAWIRKMRATSPRSLTTE